LDELFDDTEPEDDAPATDGIAGLDDDSSSFRRYVSEGLELLEEWLSDPD
jgi:hypothetical protein